MTTPKEERNAGTSERSVVDSGLRRVVTDADLERGAERLAEQATRLERDSENLLRLYEETHRNVRNAFVRIVLARRAWESRN